MQFSDYLSNATKHALGYPTERRVNSNADSKFSTVHFRIHSDVHAILKKDAYESNRSIPVHIEAIITEHYCNKHGIEKD